MAKPNLTSSVYLMRAPRDHLLMVWVFIHRYFSAFKRFRKHAYFARISGSWCIFLTYIVYASNIHQLTLNVFWKNLALFRKYDQLMYVSDINIVSKKDTSTDRFLWKQATWCTFQQIYGEIRNIHQLTQIASKITTKVVSWCIMPAHSVCTVFEAAALCK